MLRELSKALEAKSHPGLDAGLFRLARNALPYYLPFLPVQPPVTLFWAVNAVCNLRCRMCDVGQMNREGTFYANLCRDGERPEIPLETFRRVSTEMAPHRPFISINSTEPLLYPHLAEALDHCRRLGLHTGVTTNGYLLPEKAGDLAQAGLDRLNLSLDGPPQVHDHMRGVEGSFARAAEGARRFSRACEAMNRRAQIYVNVVVTNFNYAHLVALVDALGDVPHDAVNFSWQWCIMRQQADEHNSRFGERYPVSPSCLGQDADPGRVDVAVLDAQMQALQGDPRVNFMPRFSRHDLDVYFLQPGALVRPGARCLASWFMGQILADGEVTSHTRCHNVTYGNVNNAPFMSIWRGERMAMWRRFIRRHGSMPMCRRCDMMY